MLNWLFGKKKPDGLPDYTLLRETPSRTLPPELIQHESSAELVERRDRIQADLASAESTRSGERQFFVPVDGRGRQATLVFPEGQCLLVFSSVFKTADYRRTASTVKHGGVLVVPVTGFCELLRNCERAGISLWTLDRCPRCATVTCIGTEQFTSDEMVTAVWTIQHATARAHFEAYLAHALAAARAGDFRLARDVALEMVGHIDAEDPRPHMLLGQLGVATGDRTLIDEAQTFLGFFQQHAWRERLAAVVQSGQPQFDA